MTEPYKYLIGLYREVPPRDLRDAAFYVAPDVLDSLMRANVKAVERDDFTNERERYEAEAAPTQLFGIPLYTDKDLPAGTGVIICENATDRAIRRANGRGQTFNVVKFESPSLSDFILPPAPKLTRWQRIKAVFRRG